MIHCSLWSDIVCLNSGLVLLLTVLLGHHSWRKIQRKCSVPSRTGRILSETLFMFLSLAVLVFPLLGGVLLQASSQQEQVVMMFGRDSWEEDSQEVSIVLLSRLNSPQSLDNSQQWTQTVTCSEELSQVTNTSRILLADLADQTCLKLLSDLELISGKSGLILVLQTGKRDLTRNTLYCCQTGGWI